ncbi:MAG: hypothetical protein JWM11_3132 [Planctomycetaceae bacterium]|nr:hypothetical protein [Planctomycetaceae bacterium]
MIQKGFAMASVLNLTPEAELPPLRDGDRLSQPEFHQRYELGTDGLQYELLNGVVSMTPAERRQHGRYGYLMTLVLGHYEEHTPGIVGGQNSTLILDESNELQPDLHLRILDEYQGSSKIDAADYLTGSPELVIEIAYSSLKADLTVKRDIYREQGVREYLVVCVEPAEFRWFVWPEGERTIDADGILRSVAFSGLWIDSHALFQEQVTAMIKTCQAGLKTPAHAEFVQQMKSRKRI